MPDQENEEKQVSVKFNQDHVIQDEHATDKTKPTYKRGRTYRMPESSARHFVVRGIADVAVRAKAAEKQAATAAANNKLQGQ